MAWKLDGSLSATSTAAHVAANQPAAPAVPVQMQKFRIFRDAFWVSLRDNLDIAGSTAAAPHVPESNA